MNVQMRVHVLRPFVTHLLVHMHQKKKITLEIAAKIAGVKALSRIVKNTVTKFSYLTN
jgi:hypothetical protein